MDLSTTKPREHLSEAYVLEDLAEHASAAERSLPRPPKNGLAPSLEQKRLQFYLATMIADVAVLLGSFALATLIYSPARFSNDAMLAAYLLLPLYLTLGLYNGSYAQRGLTDSRFASGKAVFALLVSAALLNFFAFFAKLNAEFSRVVFVAGLGMTAVMMIGLRMAISRWIRRNWGSSPVNRLLISAGGPDVTFKHFYHVDAEKHGLVPDIESPDALDRLAKYLRNIDQVIVSCSDERRFAWAEVLKGSGVHGEVISNFAREIGALGIVHHDDAEVTTMLVSTGHLGIRARAAKRLFDLLVAGSALLVLSPLLLVCALAIKLEDGGPVFFLQRRMGRGNRFFEIFKFRSMRESDADGVQSASKDDDRVTRVGRFIRRTSIDELPQLLNVIKGDMSDRPWIILCGTRPCWPLALSLSCCCFVRGA